MTDVIALSFAGEDAKNTQVVLIDGHPIRVHSIEVRRVHDVHEDIVPNRAYISPGITEYELVIRMRPNELGVSARAQTISEVVSVTNEFGDSIT